MGTVRAAAVPLFLACSVNAAGENAVFLTMSSAVVVLARFGVLKDEGGDTRRAVLIWGNVSWSWVVADESTSWSAMGKGVGEGSGGREWGKGVGEGSGGRRLCVRRAAELTELTNVVNRVYKVNSGFAREISMPRFQTHKIMIYMFMMYMQLCICL